MAHDNHLLAQIGPVRTTWRATPTYCRDFALCSPKSFPISRPCSSSSSAAAPPTATHAAHGLLLREHGRADGGAPGPPAAGVEPQRGGGGAPNPRPRAGALRPGVQGHRGRRLRRGRRLPQPRARDQVRLRAPSLLSRAGLGGYEFRFGRAFLRSALWICWKLDGGALSCFN
jgi:hypothetical protein